MSQSEASAVATKLHRLTYFSRNMMTGGAAEQSADIESILACARRNNPVRNVTGALLLSRGCFAQVLEGEVADVEAIFARIQSDQRHADMRILQFETIVSRSFGNWSMAFAGYMTPENERLDVAGVLDNPSCFDSKEVGRQVVEVLTDLMHNTDSPDSGF